MRKKYLAAIAMIWLAAVSGCSGEPAGNSGPAAQSETEVYQTEVLKGRKLKEEEMKAGDQYTLIHFESEILAGTLTGENTEQELCVYLPPSYQESGKSYPVVYYLHGFGDSGKAFVANQKRPLDEAFTAGAEEFILVSISGTTKAGGSFYVNSPVSGNWEDYIIKEVIPIIDMNFRTLAQRDSRGICGFSMGGFGTVNLSLRNPDVFCAFLAIAPGLLEDGDLPAALESWATDSGVKRAYAQAFSPNEKDEANYGNIPEGNGTPEDEAIRKDWENGYGNIRQKVEGYLSLNQPLKAMKIIYGDMESYSWIPKGCEFLSKCLTEQGIGHSLEVIKSGHSIPPDVANAYMVPFFNEHLIYK